jgi:outer membrane protein assembly factor BamB
MTKRLLVVLVLIAAVAATACRARLPDGPEDDAPEAAGPPADARIDQDAGQVTRLDGSGRVVWSTHLDGYRGPDQLLHDAERAYVSHGDGVTALDWGTGKVVWHAKGPADCMSLSGGLLLATDSSTGGSIAETGRWLTARAVRDGGEVFRVRLPLHGFNPEPIREVAGLFLVQTGEVPGGVGDALLIDREGRVRHRFGRQVVGGIRQGEDRIFLTSRGVVRLSPEDERRWSVLFEEPEWIAGGDLLVLPGGDLLASLYGRINDSGVQVLRLNPTTGKQVWQVGCSGLGVPHSKYRHEATVAVEGGQVKVTSRGASGTFVEVLDLGSGRQLKRTVSMDP